MSEASRVAENLAEVRDRIASAAARSGRAAADVKLVAVTKYAADSALRDLIAAGCHDLGESRPQQLWQRAAAWGDNVRWHMIGHLQRNKVARTLPLVSLLHSGDSLRLLDAIAAARAEQSGEAPAAILLEVNISADPAKHGFAPTEVRQALEHAAAWPAVQIQGLMAMAGRADDPVAAREDFSRLRTLRDALQVQTGCALPELSMGMSGDYEVAIEEGATLVRVGSALFEGVDA